MHRGESEYQQKQSRHHCMLRFELQNFWQGGIVLLEVRSENICKEPCASANEDAIPDFFMIMWNNDSFFGEQVLYGTPITPSGYRTATTGSLCNRQYLRTTWLSGRITDHWDAWEKQSNADNYNANCHFEMGRTSSVVKKIILRYEAYAHCLLSARVH